MTSKFKLIVDGGVVRISDGAQIPPDPDNLDWQDYQAWVAAGNTPDPADPPPAPDYSALRGDAYRRESDPLFFLEQRKEVPEGTWLAKVNEIKSRWPA